MQRLLKPISPHAEKAGTEPQCPSLLPLEEGLTSPTSSPYTAPAVPTIFGFISGVTGAVDTLGHDRKWRQTGGMEELWD